MVWILFPGITPAQNMMKGNWMKNWGGGSGLIENHVSLYPDGTLLQIGVFNSSSITFGTITLNLVGQTNLYAANITSSGTPVWVKQFIAPSAWDVNYLGSYVDMTGNLYFVGSYADTVMSVDGVELKDDDSNPKIFMSIFDRTGRLQSHINLLPADNTCSIYPTAITWAEDGSRFAVAGYFDGDSLYAGDITLKGASGLYHLFVMVFSLNGNPLWGATDEVIAVGQQPSSDITPSNLSFGVDGSLTVVGTYYGSPIRFDDDTFPEAQESNGIMVLRYNADGKYQWGLSSVPSTYENVYSPSAIQMTGDGGFYFTGKFGPGKLDLGDVPLESPGGSSFFLYRFRKNGTVAWVTTIETGEGEGLYKSGEMELFIKESDILTTPRGDVYLLGYFTGDTLDLPGDAFDLIKKSGHSSDQFVAYFGANGMFRWARSISSDLMAPPRGRVNYDGSIFLTEAANDTLVFGEDTLAVAEAGTMIYVLGLAADGHATFLQGISGSANANMSVFDFTVNRHNNLYVLGRFESEISLGGITLAPSYSENMFLANLSPNTFLEGKVQYNGTEPVTLGMVSLIRLGSSGPAPQADMVNIMPNGRFTIRDFVYGDYLLYALPDPDNYADYVGTYLGDTPLWFLADTVHAGADTLQNLTITLVATPGDLTGQGQLEGAIYRDTSGTNLKSMNLEGEPVKKVKVILIGVQKSTVEDNVIAWAYTDENGVYHFDNIPDGNYQIMVDIPGLPLDTTYSISVQGGTISGLDFLVTDTSITIAKSTSGIFLPTIPVEEIEVYPNPTMGPVILKSEGLKAAEVTVFNLRGQAVMQFRMTGPVTRLDLSSLPDGIYYLRAIERGKMGMAKIVVRH